MLDSTLLNDMMLFLAVVENKSFTAAAEQHNITKSVVSKRISRLEHSLGVQLLYRSTRRLSLSEVGQTLYERAQQIKMDITELEQVVTSTNTEPRGRLRVSCPTSFGSQHLVVAISKFMKRFPKVTVEVMMSSEADDLIDAGIDVAIRIGDLPDSSLVARRLTVRKLRACAAPNYLEKHGTPQTPEDLVNHNCLIHDNSPSGNLWHFSKDKQKFSVTVSGNFSASSNQLLESAAVQGIGIVMLPGYMMTSDVQHGDLVRILEDYCQDELGIYALFPQSRHMAPKVRAFVDYICEFFQDETYWQ